MNLNQYYTDKYTLHKEKILNKKRKLRLLSLARILIFAITVFTIYFFLNNISLVVLISILGIVLFLLLLLKYTNLKQDLAFNKALVKINEEELKQLKGDFLFKNSGEEFQDTNHAFCLDIDLFGKGSFFQNLDRTKTIKGTSTLVNILKSNHIAQIELKQDAIKDLASKDEFRQHFQASASLIQTEIKEDSILNWINNYNISLPKPVQLLSYTFSVVSLILLGLTVFKIISPSYFGYWLLVGLGITGFYIKRVNALSHKISKVKQVFKQYSVLLKAIENQTFSSQLLKEKQSTINTSNQKASVVLKELSGYIDALDNRNNIIGAIFGNGYFLLDLKNTYLIEHWIKNNKQLTNQWFNIVAFFDAYQSLATYAFNHPEFVYSEITNTGTTTLNAENLGHPLLVKSKRITSNITINSNNFFIITGANMAGKSTFLRTISLQIVMANIGLPVCATKSTYKPIKLITSMRTTDNLTEESSYFFSELSRLKYIVDAIKNDSYFIILDEILKGTNSKDKAEGSYKFVLKLVNLNSTGIIATHDLSLCKIESELPQVTNYYFDAQITNNELFFDYKFKKGICQNMNASFLLKKMEII